MEIFYGGNVMLGRRMHWRVNEVEQFQNIDAMTRADMRIVNLTSVTATAGEPGIDKGTGRILYLRARPEQLNVLVKADIDLVLLANDHCGDYGAEAILEQNENLDRAGIFHVGAGKNLDEASAPKFIRFDELTLAIFSVDTRIKNFAADENHAGTFFIPLGQTEFRAANFNRKIELARRNADLVFVAINYNEKNPADKFQAVARMLIDFGADGVLGSHPDMFCRVEKYADRPIIFGAGTLLTDADKMIDSGCFSLNVERDGVKKIVFTPVRCGNCHTQKSLRSRERINDMFRQECQSLGTEIVLAEDGSLAIEFAPTPRDSIGAEKRSEMPTSTKCVSKNLIAPLSKPRAEWVVERVPDDAVIRPHHFGALKLLGCRVDPPVLTERRLIFIETFWSIDEKLDRDFRLMLKAAPIRECLMPVFGNREHDFLNWMFPVERWEPGVIYREKIAFNLPINKRIANVDLRLDIFVRENGILHKKYSTPPVVEMQFPKKTYRKKEYPPSIWQSKLDELWNARQLADVTDGEWIVPPPKNWRVNSVSHKMIYIRAGIMKAPILFAPYSDFWTSEKRPAVLPKSIVGIMVTEKRDDVPENLPQLKVDNIIRALTSLGYANRQRFRGREIAVTGSSGKSTTSSMIKHVLSAEHSVFSTYGNENVIQCPYVFANIHPTTSFAIIEMASSAFKVARGSTSLDLQPDIAVVTSIAEAHVLLFGSLEGIALVKSKILDGMSAGGFVVLNRDMPYYEIFERKANNMHLNIITFGTHEDAAIRMQTLENGGEFTFKGKTYKLECPVPNVQISDALAAVGVSLALGYSLERTLERLTSFKVLAGRGNVVEVNRGGKRLKIIDSTFNANIGSMSGDLRSFKTVEPRMESRVAVLGDIAELGEQSIELHKSLSSAVPEAELSRLFLCGEHMKYLWDEIKGQVDGEWFATVEELIASIDERLRDGDTILIKASHATHLNAVRDFLKKS